MKNLTFDKKCEAGRLTAELERKGFALYGVSTEEGKTIVHLKDTEKKNPTIIVKTHIFNPTRKQRFISWLMRR